MQNNLEKDTKLSSLLDDIKLELFSYVDKRFRLFKLDAFEKGGIIASQVGYSLIVSIIAGAFLFFLLIGLAFFIGEMLGSQAAGFGILALFSLLVLAIVVLCGKRLRRYLLHKTISFIQKVDKNETE